MNVYKSVNEQLEASVKEIERSKGVRSEGQSAVFPGHITIVVSAEASSGECITLGSNHRAGIWDTGPLAWRCG